MFSFVGGVGVGAGGITTGGVGSTGGTITTGGIGAGITTGGTGTGGSITGGTTTGGAMGACQPYFLNCSRVPNHMSKSTRPLIPGTLPLDVY